ncbi:AMP-binding protein [Vulcanisaeta sp. JCM 16159]|uniref:AMP-binding protein n=1 Tax=Vulcanisaeta sp. JCM 16159 TaxID=1295371 RepID=UPI0006CFDAC8|nr:AMP-binding protein [Vulcanisaeta sp. JCM 16159]
MLESLLKHRARIEDSIAIKVGDKSYTYSQLESLSNKVAFALHRLGVKPSDRVVTLVKSPLYHVALFFCVKENRGGISARKSKAWAGLPKICD